MENIVPIVDIYYYCNNESMYCSYPTKCHKITAARKNGCKYFKKLWM